MDDVESPPQATRSRAITPIEAICISLEKRGRAESNIPEIYHVQFPPAVSHHPALRVSSYKKSDARSSIGIGADYRQSGGDARIGPDEGSETDRTMDAVVLLAGLLAFVILAIAASIWGADSREADSNHRSGGPIA